MKQDEGNEIHFDKCRRAGRTSAKERAFWFIVCAKVMLVTEFFLAFLDVSKIC